MNDKPSMLEIKHTSKVSEERAKEALNEALAAEIRDQGRAADVAAMCAINRWGEDMQEPRRPESDGEEWA